MAGDGIEVIVQFLDVLAVVSLSIGKPKQTLLENRITAVPERKRQAEKLLVVGKPGQAVLPPAIGVAARLVVGQIIPRGAARAVVLAHCPPLPLAQIGAPLAPILLAIAALLDALALDVGDLRHGANALGGEGYCFIAICVSSCQASSVLATDQACAGAPRGWCGASEAILPRFQTGYAAA